jgi:hypothetical protein
LHVSAHLQIEQRYFSLHRGAQSCLLAHFNSLGCWRGKRASLLSSIADRPHREEIYGRMQKRLSTQSLSLSVRVRRSMRERNLCAPPRRERELICEKLRGIKWFLIKFQAVPMADGARRGMNKGIINLL